MKPNDKLYAQNKRAKYDYFIEETIEAGIVLTGTEIKSIRKGKASINEGFIQIKNGEVFLLNVHISPFEEGNRHNVEPVRTRKLLLHKEQIVKWRSKVKEQGYTIIPISLYNSNGFCKISIGLVKGKKNYDKRHSIAERDAKRTIDKSIKDNLKNY